MFTAKLYCFFSVFGFKNFETLLFKCRLYNFSDTIIIVADKQFECYVLIIITILIMISFSASAALKNWRIHGIEKISSC